MSKTKYFTFPVVLLKNMPTTTDLNKVTEHIILYGMYQYATHLSEKTLLDIETCFGHTFDYFGITPTNAKSIFRNATELFESIPEGLPMTSISTNVIFDYRRSPKTEFEIMCLCGFASIKSILGKKPYAKITNDYFFARMFGFASVEELKSDQPTLLGKYAKRYQLDKIKEELQASWGIKIYGYKTRGFYVSISMDYESLVFQAEKKRKSRLRQERKAAEAEAQKRVLRRLEGK